MYVSKTSTKKIAENNPWKHKLGQPADELTIWWTIPSFTACESPPLAGWCFSWGSVVDGKNMKTTWDAPKRSWYWYKTNIWGILSGAGFLSINLMVKTSSKHSLACHSLHVRGEVLAKHRPEENPPQKKLIEAKVSGTSWQCLSNVLKMAGTFHQQILEPGNQKTFQGRPGPVPVISGLITPISRVATPGKPIYQAIYIPGPSKKCQMVAKGCQFTIP